jgi:hypothetical protein
MCGQWACLWCLLLLLLLLLLLPLLPPLSYVPPPFPHCGL